MKIRHLIEISLLLSTNPVAVVAGGGVQVVFLVLSALRRLLHLLPVRCDIAH